MATERNKDIIDRHQRMYKWDRLIRHLGISMSVISGHTVTTLVNNGINAPASTMETVQSSPNEYWRKRRQSNTLRKYTTQFNVKQLPEQDLAVWLGVAWHELGHVLWSPRFSQGITVGLNLLEDARIEALLIGTYPRTKGALMSMLRWMISIGKGGSLEYSYAWLVGRTHLPKALRKEYRNRLNPQIAKQIESIFKRYLSMGATLDQTKAAKLANELDAIFGTVNDVHVCDAIHRTGDAAESTGEMSEDLKDLELGEDDDNDSDGSGSDQLDEAIANDESLAEEVQTLKNMVGAGGAVPREIEKAVTPSTQAKKLAHDVKRVAAKFNDESGKGLVRRRDYGRIKPIRYERTGDLDTAYDMWEPGLDQEMYVSLVIDASGSMVNSPIGLVVYGLEQGLSDVAIVDTVYFNDNYYVSSVRSSEHRMVLPFARGGTAASKGIAYAYTRILQEAAANKILVLYTDGQFDNTEEYIVSAAYIDQLMRQGIDVRLVADHQGASSLRKLIARSAYLREANTYQVQKIEDLPDIVLQWTKDILTKPIGGW